HRLPDSPRRRPDQHVDFGIDDLCRLQTGDRRRRSDRPGEEERSAEVATRSQETDSFRPDGARRMTMNDLQRSAIVAALVNEYRARNSFCGETMVQKSVFFLQELLKVPLAFDFQLYIYGPFSFALQRHVASMMADDMI